MLSITAANIRSDELSSTDLEKEVGTEAHKLAKYRISRSIEANINSVNINPDHNHSASPGLDVAIYRTNLHIEAACVWFARLP